MAVDPGNSGPPTPVRAPNAVKVVHDVDEDKPRIVIPPLSPSIDDARRQVGAPGDLLPVVG